MMRGVRVFGWELMKSTFSLLPVLTGRTIAPQRGGSYVGLFFELVRACACVREGCTGKFGGLPVGQRLK